MKKHTSSKISNQGLGRLTGPVTVVDVIGCTDVNSINYNSDAIVDDGSCVAMVPGCNDPSASNYNSLANSNDGSCAYLGCMDSNAINYNPSATADDGSCVGSSAGCTNNATYTYTGTSGNSQVYQAYLNYSPTYNIDDGSCIARVFGCMNPTAFNYNPAANTQPAGECIFVYPGCMDPNSCTYNSLATEDDGSCVACDDPLANNNDFNTVGCSAFCQYCLPVEQTPAITVILGGLSQGDTVIDGLTVLEKDNFSIKVAWPHPVSDALPDGTLSAPVQLHSLGYKKAGEPNWNTINIPFAVHAYGYETYDITGLEQDVDYDIRIGAQCSNSFSSYTNISVATENFIYGCTLEGYDNFDANANFNDGSCVLVGCTDFYAINFNSLANTDDGSCLYYIAGCIDVEADNYNSNATIDDGSCVYTAVTGCTNELALNYNDVAVTDDGSCLLCQTDPGVDAATISVGFLSSTLGNYSTVTWANIGTNTTNGSYQEYVNSSFINNGIAYKVFYKYNTGSGWSNNDTFVEAENPLNLSTDTCGIGASVLGQDQGLLPPGLNFGASLPLFGPNDGRYARGVQYQLEIRNMCTNCESSDPIITPVLTIPTY